MSNHLLDLHHVGIVVRDLEASVAWYGRHLGFERVYDLAIPGAIAAMIHRGDLRLELLQTEGATPMAAERKQFEQNLKIGGISHLAIAVDDLDRAYADLEANGVEAVLPPADVPQGRGDRYAYLRDNEGMLFELFQPAA